MSEYEALCHGQCSTVKLRFLFTPSQLKQASPICRKCASERNKERRVGNPVPAISWRVDINEFARR